MVRDSNSGHQLLLPPANWCPTFASRTTQDIIELAPAGGAALSRRLTVVLHKPMSFLSQSTNPRRRQRLATSLLTRENQAASCSYRGPDPVHLSKLGCCGRLDADSTGLLIFSQDGTVARRLLGTRAAPSLLPKHYLVDVVPAQGPSHGGRRSQGGGGLPSDVEVEAMVEQLRHGLELDDEPLRPAEVAHRWVAEDPAAGGGGGRRLQLGMVLQQGKYRQIRRMCNLVGLEAVRLRRTAIGSRPAGLELEALGLQRPGSWRVLSHRQLAEAFPLDG